MQNYEYLSSYYVVNKVINQLKFNRSLMCVDCRVSFVDKNRPSRHITMMLIIMIIATYVKSLKIMLSSLLLHTLDVGVGVSS